MAGECSEEEILGWAAYWSAFSGRDASIGPLQDEIREVKAKGRRRGAFSDTHVSNLGKLSGSEVKQSCETPAR